MAKIKSPFKLSGSIGDLVSRNENGKQIACLKNHFGKEIGLWKLLFRGAQDDRLGWKATPFSHPERNGL